MTTTPVQVPDADAPPPAGRYKLVAHKVPLKTLWNLSDRGFLFLVGAALLKVLRMSPGKTVLNYPAALEDVAVDSLDEQARFALDALRYELRERGFTPGPVVRQRLDSEPLAELIALSSNRMTVIFATFQGPPSITLLSLHGRGDGVATTNTRVMDSLASEQLDVERLSGASLSKLTGAHEMRATGTYRTLDLTSARAAGCTIRDVAMERMINHGMLVREDS